MRIFGKILKFLFVLCAVASIGLSISVYASSSFKLVFKEDLNIRKKIEENTLVTLNNTKENRGLSFEHNYYIDANNYVEESIHCVYEVVEQEKATVCQWLEKIYNVSVDENEKKIFKLSRTSFINGDNYMYTTDGINKTKKVSSGKDLINTTNELLTLYLSYINHIDDFSDEKRNKFVEYNISLDFRFNSFKLYKNISYIKIENRVKTKINYIVDHKDRISRISLEDGMALSFKYGDYKLILPSTDGYVTE